jgi:hypothetical protein|tara:strand:+ start:293 stop:721 length:429 start_codon:yes stop_codon:yes gene_type:complete
MNEEIHLTDLEIYYVTIASKHMTRLYIDEQRILQPGIAISPSGIAHAIQGLDDDYLLEKLLKFCKYWDLWVNGGTLIKSKNHWDQEELHYYMAIVINDYLDELEDIGVTDAYPHESEHLLAIIDKIQPTYDDDMEYDDHDFF